MKCSICGSISMNDKFCGVCGTRFDTKPEEPTPVLSREKMRGSGRTAVKFLFWIALVPLGWLIFNTDFTDLLAGLRLPYVYAFPFTGFALIVIGAPMALITIWDSLSSLVPDGFYRRAHSAREEWKNLGTLARFLVISTVGELAILGLGWTIWVALGIDYHASIAIILAVVLLFGAGLFQGRNRRYYPRGQRYDRYLERQAGKMSKPKGRWLIPATYILWITVTLAVILLG